MTKRRAGRRKVDRLTPAEAARPQPIAQANAAASIWTLPLIGLVSVGVLLRLYYLRQPMRYDESVTYVSFAAQSWTTVLSSYVYPNNHVFHSLLVKAFASLLGNEPWVLRLPALITGVAMIPLTFALGCRLFGAAAAYVGTALVAASGALALYSTNARGYTMIGAATLVLASLALRLRERPSTRLWVAAVVVTALGLWTVPVMLFPAAGFTLWFVLSAVYGDTSGRRADVWRAVLAGVVTAILTLLLYSPIIAGSGLAALTRNSFVTPSMWVTFFRQLISSTEQTLAGWTLAFPIVVSVSLGVCAVIGLMKERQIVALRVSIAGSVYVACAAMLLIMRRAPYPRVWLFLVAPVSLLAAHGFIAVLSRLRPFGERIITRAGPLSVVVAAALAGAVILSQDVLTSRDSGTLRDAEPIANALSSRLRPGDRVIAPIPSNGPLTYYFVRSGFDTTYLSSTPSDSSVYLVVNTDEGYTLTTPLGDRRLRRFRRAQLVARYASAEVYRLR